MPKISFILPVIRTRFLAEALSYIYHQTMQDWEMILINNTPAEKIMADDDRIRIIKPKRPLNISESINLGNSLAQSNIILQVQDDDISFAERAEVTYHLMNNHDIDILSCSIIQIDIDNRPIRYWQAKPFDFEKQKCEGGTICFSHIAYKKDKAPPMRENIIIQSDYAFIYDAYLKGLKFRHTQIPLGIYRWWNGCSSKQKNGQKEKDILLMRKIFDDPAIKTVGFGSLPEGAENETIIGDTLAK